MWPRVTYESKLKIKQATRSREIGLAMDTIRRNLNGQSDRVGDLKVLEIGSGDGTQCKALIQFGPVAATDRFVNPDLKLPLERATFTICDARQLPLPAGSQELIYANHVIEHIPELPAALAEMKRVAGPQCVLAFSVPTSLWLMLSLPGQYWDKVCHIAGRVIKKFRKKPQAYRLGAGEGHEQAASVRTGPRQGWRKLLPTGHGEYPGFFQCLWSFRSSRWKRIFREAGLKLIHVEPLLLYSTSRWPFVPACRWPTKLGLCSSRLYLLAPDNELRKA